MIDHRNITSRCEPAPPEKIGRGCVPAPLFIFQKLLSHEELRNSRRGEQQSQGDPRAAASIPRAAIGGIGEIGDALVCSDLDDVVILHARNRLPTVGKTLRIKIRGNSVEVDLSFPSARSGGAMNMAPSVPWPTLLGNTQVLLGGRPMPLYFVSNQQIAAVVPYDIAPNSVQQVIVQNGTAVSQPETVTVAAAQPGVFSQNSSGTGPGSIFGQKPGGIPVLNTAANPASAGDALWIFCTGLGTVSPPVPAGAAASATTLSFTDNPVTVTVGGKDAQ